MKSDPHASVITRLLIWLTSLHPAVVGIAAPPSAEQVQTLVRQLESTDLVERHLAARKLETLGPIILPLLPVASAETSPATQSALSILRQQLERRLAKEAVQSSVVTVTGPASLVMAAQRLSEQTGNRLLPVTGIEASSILPLDWQALPFWDAVNDLERHSRRTLRWVATDIGFGLQPDVGMPLAAAVSGPFRMTVASMEQRQAGEQSLVRFTCVLQIEPRLRPLFVQWPLKSWRWNVGSDSVTAWNQEAVYELPFTEDGREVRLAVDFPARPFDLRKDWTLAGECTVHLAAGREPLTFAGADLRRGGSLRRGGVTGTLRSVRFDRMDADSLSSVVRIVVNYDRGGPAFESHRLGLFQRSAWLEQADGVRIPFAGFEVVAETDGGLAVEYRFDRLTPPASQYCFVLEVPTLLLEVPARFVLRPPSSASATK